MSTLLLYITVVMIWGSTFIAVKFQVGVVAVEASVAYRIGIAACFMFAWSILRRLFMHFAEHNTVPEHPVHHRPQHCPR